MSGEILESSAGYRSGVSGGPRSQRPPVNYCDNWKDCPPLKLEYTFEMVMALVLQSSALHRSERPGNLRNPKGKKTAHHFRSEAPHAVISLSREVGEGRRRMSALIFPPGLTGFLPSSAFVSLHYLLCLLAGKCFTLSPFPVLGACWGAFLQARELWRRGLKVFKKTGGKLLVFFFFFFPSYVVNVHTIQVTRFKVFNK